jgi:hypothetical protein
VFTSASAALDLSAAIHAHEHYRHSALLFNSPGVTGAVLDPNITGL